jgi:hypothetical protein
MALHEGLFTAGELLRADQLGIDTDASARPMFDEAPAP